MTVTHTHPDYSGRQFPPGGGDRCVCGGVRHWHAKAPNGCDDCKSCSEFRPIEDAYQRAERDARELMAYEAGQLSMTQTLDLFSRLIASGTAQNLQGSYGRAATGMIDSGFITREGQITDLGRKVSEEPGLTITCNDAQWLGTFATIVRDLGKDLEGPLVAKVTLASGEPFVALWTAVGDDHVTDGWFLHFADHDSVSVWDVRSVTI